MKEIKRKEELQIFRKELGHVRIQSWFLKMFFIPVGFLLARLVSDVALHASQGNIRQTVATGGLLLAAALGTRIFVTWWEIGYQKAVSGALHQCKILLYQQMLSGSLCTLYSFRHGEAKERLNDDFNTVAEEKLTLYPEFWTGILTVIVYAVYLASNSPMVAAVLIAISFLQIVPPLIVKKYMQVNYENCREIEAQISDTMLEGIRGFVTIKLYHLQQWWLERYKTLHKTYAKIGNQSVYTAQAETAMYTLLDNILKYGTYGILGVLVLIEQTSMETGIQAIALSGGFFGAVKTVFSAIPRFAVARTAEDRLKVWFADAKEEPGQSKELVEDSQGMKIRKESAAAEAYEIQLSDVSYTRENTVLKSVSATFPGGKLAVVQGENGIGKSTLLNLITGLLQCDSGSVLIGGQDVHAFEESDFPGKLFYLPQEDAMFGFSAKELYHMMAGGREGDAIEIARRFGVPDKALREAKMNELSGGERKKVFLSIAFVLEPPVLILDEPLNSLDDVGKAFLGSLLKQRKGTTIVVTHEQGMEGIAQGRYWMREGGGIHGQMC